jgi:4-amino-4-deoxy-L-arabinose transferase-like glycosyltransferase
LPDAVLALSLAAYLALGMVRLDQPPADFEEVAAVASVKVFQVGPSAPGNMWFELPYSGPQHGAAMTYFVWPPLRFLGADVTNLRVVLLLFGAATLAAVRLFAGRVFGPGTAAASTALLAFHPTFLAGTRQGAHHGSLLLFFAALSAVCLWDWWDRGRPWGLVAGSFCLGIGLSTFSWYAFWLGAVAVCAVVYRRPLRARLRAAPRLALSGALAAFGLGVASLAVQFGGFDGPDFLFQTIQARAVLHGAPALFDLPGSWSALWRLMDGSGLQPTAQAELRRTMFEFFQYPRAWPRDPYSWCLLASLGWAAAGWRAPGGRRRAALAVLVVAFVSFASFNPTNMNPNHHFTVFPWTLLLIAACGCDAAARSRSRFLGAALASAVLAGLFLHSAGMDAAFLDSIDPDPSAPGSFWARHDVVRAWTRLR